MGGALAGFGAGRDAQLQRRLPPCVYDERPRLPVGLAVGAADQAPRACDSARGLTGKERAISRFVAPGPRVRIHLPPAASQVRTRAGVQALILILDNHEFFRQVGVALTTVIPRNRTGLIAAIVGMGRRPRADRLLPIG